MQLEYSQSPDAHDKREIQKAAEKLCAPRFGAGHIGDNKLQIVREEFDGPNRGSLGADSRRTRDPEGGV